MQLTMPFTKLYSLFFQIVIPLFPLFYLLKLGDIFYSIIIISFFLWLIGKIIRKEFKIRYLKIGFPFYAWYFTFLLSLLWAKYPIETLEKLVSFSLWVWVLYISIQLFSSGKRYWFLKLSTSMYFVVLICFVYILFMYGGVKFGTSITEEIGFFSPTGLAIITAYYPYLLYMFFQKRHNQWVLLSVILSIPFLVLISGNRSSILLSVLGTILFIILISKNLLKTAKLIFVSCLIFIVVGSLIYYTIPAAKISLSATVNRTIHSSLFTFSSTSISDRKIMDYEENIPDQDRVLMFILAYEIIKSNPLTGIGFHGFKSQMEERFGHGRISHNLIITSWAEGGILSLITFLLLVLVCYIRLFRSRTVSKKLQYRDGFLFYSSAITSFTLVLVHGMVQPQEYNPMFYFNIAIALTSLFLLNQNIRTLSFASLKCDRPCKKDVAINHKKILVFDSESPRVKTRSILLYSR